MTSRRQIATMVKPLLAAYSNLALLDGIVIVRPVNHFVRGIVIDRTSQAVRFRVEWALTSLYNRQTYFPLGLGADVYGGERGWLWSDRDVSARFLNMVESELLPKLTSINTLKDFVEFATPADPRVRDAVASGQALNRIALGDLEEARRYLAKPNGWRFWQPHLERLGLHRRLMEQGSALGMDDRATLAGLLHEWEAYTVGKLKLESIWERTPFPLEEPPG